MKRPLDRCDAEKIVPVDGFSGYSASLGIKVLPLWVAANLEFAVGAFQNRMLQRDRVFKRVIRTKLLYILVSPSANSRLYYAPSGKALILGMKNMVKFAVGEQEINPTLKMCSSMNNNGSLKNTCY
jgi:hypothetical protein